MSFDGQYSTAPQYAPQYENAGAPRNLDGALRLLELSFKVSSVSLAALALISLGHATLSDCGDNGVQAKRLPFLVALFVGALAYGAWKLRAKLSQGFDILEMLPDFFRKAGPEGLPPQVGQWKDWTWKWLICFCGLIWGGIFVIEYYCVLPLTEKCAKEPPSAALEYLSKARNAIVFFLIFITCVPLLLGMWQMRKFKDSYTQGQKTLGGLHPDQGGLIQRTGSTQLFDATFQLGELAGYAGYHRQGAAAEPQASFDRRMSSGAL